MEYDVEYDGVRGVRSWADEAIGRAKMLLPTPERPVTPTRSLDDSIAELTELSRLLDQDPELRSSTAVWLGGALTLRHASGSGTPADRERAHGLLRDTRDPGTEIGSTTSVEDRRWAALFLLTHTLPLQEMMGGLAPEPDMTAFFDLMMREGPSGMASLTSEVMELVTDAVELPLPPETLGHLRRVRDLQAHPSAEGLTDLLTALLPSDGHPIADQLRATLARMATSTEPESGPASSSDVPGTPRTPEEVRRLIVALQAANTTSVDFVNQVGGGDPAALNQQLGRLREALDGLPDEVANRDGLEGLMALLLNVSEGAGGTLQDQALGFAHSQRITDFLRRHSESSIPMADSFAIMADGMRLMTDIRSAGQAEDLCRLRELLPQAEAFSDSVPEDHDLRSIALVMRAMARLTLGHLTRDRELLLSGLTDYEDGSAAARHSSIPVPLDALLDSLPDLASTRAYLSGDTTSVPEPDVPPEDATADQLYSAANRLGLRYSTTKDPADLEAVITTLERFRAHVRQGRAPRVAAQSLWSLAESYRERWRQEQDGTDVAAAVGAANEALATLAADVLLQQGTEHRLTTARNGASLGIRAALWAAARGHVDDAVAALELGRALVLQAAATSRSVPDLLQERGHPELADAWRSSGAEDSAELPSEMPSTLRRQALEALGYRERGNLLNTPTLRELSDGVGEAGADALIYLVPGNGGEAPGMVLAVGPEIGIGVGALPSLSEAGSAVLERYVDAVAARSATPDAPEAAQVWEGALSDLCDWAYEVFSDVLAGLTRHLPDDATDSRTPRIVLVPCGRLGIVPWHAARFPADAPYDHLCEALVISYAASGGQFLRTVKRAPRDPISAPVMVADPTLELTYAELEVLEVRDAFYPGARLYGDFGSLPPESVPTGTPDELLALLGQDHSMVHLATHGMAGVRPTESALHLAPTDTDDDDTGRLTVTRLLDRPQPAEEAAPDGPLVVLSACETDLSKRDHDEALTLATAFVSGGARDVVGSRWAARDSSSMLLMAVFHHHVRAGLSPADALRAAQLWMLDPERRDPGRLSDQLRQDISRPDLSRPALWAAFTHQGHPGRGKETV